MSPLLRRLHAVAFLSLGSFLSVGGGYLAALGGSFYYVLAGPALVATGVLRWRGDRRAAGIYAAFLLATALWAAWEVGFSVWGFLPRLGLPGLLGLFFIATRLRGQSGRLTRLRSGRPVAMTLASLAAIALVAALRPSGPAEPARSAAEADAPIRRTVPPGDGQWLDYSGGPEATHFSTLDQITPDNVGSLDQAWTYRTGEDPDPEHPRSSGFQDTPLAVRDKLFICTPGSKVDALDADTGKRLWRFDPGSDNPHAKVVTCRGVAYAATPNAQGLRCNERLLLQTGDARLIAIDAQTGEKCTGFGHNGETSLLEGMGPVRSGHLGATSPPLIVGSVAIVGNQVFDNDSVGEPSGVIRAYDIVTGSMLWAWDMGHPHEHGLPPEGRNFTRGTPNAWGVLTADARLGLVYIPLGNQTPDFYAGKRLPESERFTDSIAALDIATGKLRWTFQTVHHDTWDYDLPVGPTLVDWGDPHAPTPAVIVSTKRGEFFVLNRRTGTPLSPVVEQDVPHDSPLPGEWLAKTQPFSPGMPQLNGGPITESQMWGMTPLDQLQCRIRFRSLRYNGQFTPLSTRGSIYDPGPSGYMNWGGVSIDEARRLMLVNYNRMPFVMTAIPRAEAEAMGVVAGPGRNTKEFDGISAMAGTPFAVKAEPFLSAAHVPCIQPPWGFMQAIDLDTKRTIWKRPLGTGRDTGPFGLKFGPPVELGVFTQGGSVATASGLTFIGSTVDRYLRAIDSRTGRELWRARLPAGGQANPMTFRSTTTGKQYIVIAAGGHASLETKRGDYLVAFALPQNKSP